MKKLLIVIFALVAVASVTGITIACLGHTTHTEAEPVRENELAPTCISDGYYEEVIYCTECKEEMRRTPITIKKNNHVPSNSICENKTAATCTSDGHYDEVVYCSICSTELSRMSKTISQTNHSPNSAIRENEVAAACEVDGCYDEVVYCTDCHTELSRETKVLPKLSHGLIGKTIELPSCEVEQTYDAKYCENCATLIPVESNVLHAHSYERKYNELFTNFWFECKLCGHIKSKQEDDLENTILQSKKHIWEIFEINAPTCTENGSITIVCKKCNFGQTFAIPASGHIWDNDEIITPPTCTQSGEVLQTCTKCQQTQTASVPPIEHSWYTVTVEESTSCVDPGQRKTTCCTCGEEYYTVYYSDHTYGDLQCVQKETCTTMGIYKQTCSICFYENYVYINDGHTYDNGTITKQATCTEGGSITYTCTVCGASNNESIPSLDHDWTLLVSIGKTCTTDGYIVQMCQRCYLISALFIPARHIMSDVYDETYHWSECERCNYTTAKDMHSLTLKTYTDEIDDGTQLVYSHTLVNECDECEYTKVVGEGDLHIHYETEIIDYNLPTCTEDGFLPGLKCAVEGCNLILIESLCYPALGHLWEHCNCVRCGETLLDMELSEDGTYYIVKGMGNYNGRTVVIPAVHNGKPVQEIGDGAFWECLNLLSVEIGSNVITIDPNAFVGCIYLKEIINKSTVSISRDIAYDIWDIHDGVSKLIELDEYLFYPKYDNEIYLVGYAGTDIDLILPERFPMNNSTRILLPSVITAEDFENTFLIPLIKKYEALLEYCSIPLPFFNNEDYTPYKYGCIDKNQLRTYLRDTYKVFSRVYREGEKYKLLSTMMAEVQWFSDYYVLCNPEQYQALEYSATELEELYLRYPILKEGTAIYECSGNARKKEDLSRIVSKHFPNYNYELMREQELAAGFDAENYKIDRSAFYGCDNIENIILSDGVTNTDLRAFVHCKSLANLTFGKNVSIYINYWLSECQNLVNITVSPDNKNYKTIDGHLYSKDGKVLIQCAINKNETNLVIPETVETISDGALAGFDSIVNVTIPSSVTNIGNSAFYGCSNITGITIPDSVTSIGSSAFAMCSNLASFVVSENHTVYESIDGNLYSKAGPYLEEGVVKYYGLALKQYAIGKTQKYFSIPDSVIVIAKHAFAGCTSLVSVTIPDSVTDIQEYAFYDCNALEDIHFGNGVRIWNSAFEDCSSLKNLVLPNGADVYAWAFHNCSGIVSIVLPDDVSLRGNPFEGCDNVSFIYILGPKPEDNLDDSSSVITIYYYSESQPTEEGNFWHYDENGEVAVW